MGEVPLQASSGRSERVVEKVLRQLLEHPTAFSYGALAISTAIALLDGVASLQSGVLFLGQLLLFIAWIQLWSRRRARDPMGHSVWTIILAFGGILLLASLSARHLSF